MNKSIPEIAEDARVAKLKEFKANLFFQSNLRCFVEAQAAAIKAVLDAPISYDVGDDFGCTTTLRDMICGLYAEEVATQIISRLTGESNE